MNKKNLTEKERYQLEILLKQKIPKTQIAKILGVCRQTIYNEIKRGTVKQIDSNLKEYTVYLADRGQQVHDECSSNKGRSWKIENDYDFVKYVEYMITVEKYSPYALLQNIKNQGLHFKTEICLKTLYNYIHQGVFLNVSAHDLPYRKKKKTQKKIIRKVCLKKPLKPSIEDRPELINSRAELGHWEMDTVYSGKDKGKACLLVLTERKARNELVISMPNRKAESVTKSLNRLYRIYGAEKYKEIFKSITCDNGSEFAEYEKYHTQVFFCHPFCSGERGSNENNNKLIRRWYKKGASLKMTKKEADRLQDWQNNYPRKIFGGMSAKMYYESCTKNEM